MNVITGILIGYSTGSAITTQTGYAILGTIFAMIVAGYTTYCLGWSR